MKAFLYCRKSTESEDRQVLSLASQKEEMVRREGADPELSLVGTFVEARSAKRPGRRAVFSDMLDRIAAGEAECIIVWHPDRLARNMVDGGRIIDLLDTDKLRDVSRHVKFHPSSTSEIPPMPEGARYGGDTTQ